jgi:hypothetical protein
LLLHVVARGCNNREGRGMTINAFVAEIERCGACEELPKKQRWAAMQRWREVFAAPYHAATGKWRKHGDFDWHVFTPKHFQALSGSKAVELYEGQPPTTFVVVPDEEFQQHLPAFRCRGGGWPNFRRFMIDVYVWPEDVGWTMVFTHEESIGIGPYFCRREWVG